MVTLFQEDPNVRLRRQLAASIAGQSLSGAPAPTLGAALARVGQAAFAKKALNRIQESDEAKRKELADALFGDLAAENAPPPDPAHAALASAISGSPQIQPGQVQERGIAGGFGVPTPAPPQADQRPAGAPSLEPARGDQTSDIIAEKEALISRLVGIGSPEALGLAFQEQTALQNFVLDRSEDERRRVRDFNDDIAKIAFRSNINAQNRQPRERDIRMIELMKRGLTPEQAQDVADGNLELREDKFGILLFNKATGQATRVRAPLLPGETNTTPLPGAGGQQQTPGAVQGVPAPAQPAAPAAPAGGDASLRSPALSREAPISAERRAELSDKQSVIIRSRSNARNIANAANTAVGPIAAIKNLTANLATAATLGQAEAFPEVATARQQVRAYNKFLRSSFIENPRFPVAEQEMVARFQMDEDGFFNNPITNVRKAAGFMLFLDKQFLDNEAILNGRIPNSPAMPREVDIIHHPETNQWMFWNPFAVNPQTGQPEEGWEPL